MGNFDGANVSPYCREMAVVKDEMNSLKIYPVFWLVCQFMFLQPLYSMREFFLCGQGLNWQEHFYYISY